MPDPGILLNANALAHASVFCCGSARAFHGVAKNALIALHGKLNKIAQAIACFLLPGDAAHVAQWLEYVEVAERRPRQNRQRSEAVE